MVSFMGASEFKNTIVATSAKEGYRSLVEAALHDSGHDGYNGTISTTNGFVMIAPKPGETADECAERVLEGDLHGVEKRGDAGCIDLGPAKAAGKRKFMFFGWAAE